MKIKQLLLLPLLLLFGTLAAQSSQDIIYLKDGSVIRGEIIEHFANKETRIKTVEGKIYTFQSSEIKKAGFNGKTNVKVKSKGYFNNSSLQLYFGNRQVRPGFHTLNGFRFKDHYEASVGIGLDFLNWQVALPVYGNFRYNLLKGDVSPFVEAFGGYSKILSDSYQDSNDNGGGLILGGGIGLRNMVKDRFGYTLSLGYKHQNIQQEYTRYYWSNGENYSYQTTEKRIMHRLSLGFGILFN